MNIKSFEEFNESRGFSLYETTKYNSVWTIKDKNHTLAFNLNRTKGYIIIEVASFNKKQMTKPKTQIEIYNYKDITYDDMKAVKEIMEFTESEHYNTFVFKKFLNQTKDINQDIDILNSLSLEYFSKKVDNKTKDKIIEHYHNGEYKNIKSIIKDYREQVLELEAEFDKTNSKTPSSVFDNLWSRALLIGDVIMESYPTMYDEICIKSGLNRTTDLFSKYAIQDNKLQESSYKEDILKKIKEIKEQILLNNKTFGFTDNDYNITGQAIDQLNVIDRQKLAEITGVTGSGKKVLEMIRIMTKKTVEMLNERLS